MINNRLCDINASMTIGEERRFDVAEYGVPIVELMGRLAYCGFEVTSGTYASDSEEAVSRESGAVVAKKVAEAVEERREERRYGWVVKMRRIGKDGKRFDVYKFRTMYRYSEYLQEWMYERYGLNEKGKFNNDFRITKCGRWMRRCWVDELPNIVNLLRGEMKIVGVRPLSEQYFGLYDEAVQSARVRFKPGLIPPFYLDRPKSLEEIQRSEMRYIEACDRDGERKTDWKYFWRIITLIFKKNEK